jgi:pSer/pThr/pTyr-binding forkhead associated (FHA) protein
VELNSKYISRFHSRIDLADDELLIKDLGSSSGTKVNGKMIAEHKLKKGDQIKLGKTLMLFFGM